MEQIQRPYIVSPRASVEESAHEALLYVEFAVEVAGSLIQRQVLNKYGIFEGNQRVSTLADESNAAATSFLPH